MVPQRYWQASDWDEFTAACVRYDPPELDLAEFAEYGGLTSEGVEHSREEQESGEGRTIAPPVEYIDSVGQRADALEEFYRGVIEELGRRHFAPLGEDVYQAISDIYKQTDLLERLQTRMREIETHPYIAVNKDTSNEDVLSAARVIRARRGKNPGGKPSRDKLTAIKCAALFHDHNFKDPQNKGRSQYTYESLVEKFELDPAENAREVNKQDHKERERRKAIGKEYVKLGEQLRKERQRNRGV